MAMQAMDIIHRSVDVLTWMSALIQIFQIIADQIQIVLIPLVPSLVLVRLGSLLGLLTLAAETSMSVVSRPMQSVATPVREHPSLMVSVSTPPVDMNVRVAQLVETC